MKKQYRHLKKGVVLYVSVFNVKKDIPKNGMYLSNSANVH